jgi:hypothetical protein
VAGALTATRKGRGGRLLLLACLMLTVAACGGSERREVLRELAGGRDMRVRISTGDTKRDATIRVRPVTLPQQIAVTGASYEMARHCIRWTGRSTAVWTADAAGQPIPSRTENAWVFQARCVGR